MRISIENIDYREKQKQSKLELEQIKKRVQKQIREERRKK